MNIRIILFLSVSVLAACAGQPIKDSTTEGYAIAEDGVRIYYRSVGEGSDVLVVPAAMYLEEVLLPLSIDRRVIFYDPRNRGRSDASALSTISLDRQIADLEVLRKEIGIDKMALLGWSAFGMEMAVYSLKYPQHVTRLIQVSTIPPAATIMEKSGDARESNVDQLAIDALEQQLEEGVFEGRSQEYCRLSNELYLPASFVNLELMAQVPDGCIYSNEWPEKLWPYWNVLDRSYGDYDWRQEMKSLRVSRLIIHGREDRIPLAGAYAWARSYPEARLMILSPSGHFPFIEQPVSFFAAVETFLNGAWPEGAAAVPE